MKKHLREELQPLLDGLIKTDDGESWPLLLKPIPRVGDERAKGGWFYQLVYPTKDFGLDHCKVSSHVRTHSRACT